MKKELVEIRKLMNDDGMDAYFIPSSDFHGSECVNDYFKTLEFMSNFTGEAGDMLITEEGAWLWTDGRFFLQAEQQLKGSGIELMRMSEPGVPKIEELLTELVNEFKEKYPETDYTIGFDGRVVPAKFGIKLENTFACPEWKVRFKTDEDLIDKIWSNRPALRASDIWEFPIESAGMRSEDKITAVRDEMKKKGVDYLLIGDLTENAWLFNLRASDILYTPVFFAFTLLTQDCVRLYVMEGAFRNGVPERLSYVDIRDYNDIYHDIYSIDPDKTIWFDSNSCNYELYTYMRADAKKIDEYTPAAIMKTVKNDTEIACAKKAHIKDGVAVIKLIKWLKDSVESEKLTEIEVSDKLKTLRFEQDGCFDLSFETISAYGSNAAIIHYAPTPNTNAVIKSEGLLLIDSGAHYLDGTTDVTRTVAMGPLTEEMIEHYTYVLKAHVDVHLMKLEPGTTGKEVDDIGRKALKDAGLDFKHGLGHGVGHVLSVHEGPNTLSRNAKSIELKAGMIMSNEPGVYHEGKFGIRIENLMLFLEDDKSNLVNTPLTCVPYERRAINKSLLSEEEIAWVNEYHEWVRNTLVPLLDEKTAAFLIEETEPL